MVRLIPFFLLWLCRPVCAAPDAAGVDVKKRELEQIQQRLEDRRRQLDEFRSKEKDLSRYISFLKIQEDKARRKSGELAREIDGMQRRLSDSENRHHAIESSRKSWEGAFDAALSRYIETLYRSGGLCCSEELPSGAALKSAAFNGAGVLNLLREEDRKSRDKIAQLEARTTDLSRSAKTVSRELETKKQTYRKSTAELEQARKKGAEIAAELEELKKTARSLSDFLENFEKKQAAAAKKPLESGGRMPVARHSLPWPVRGRVVSRFGKEQLEALKTWVLNEGIKIAASSDEPVLCVEAGEVIYAGRFRTYGNVVIVDHKQGFFSIYGQLGSIAAQKGQQLASGGRVGTVGREQQTALNEDADRSVLYFELRVGSRAVNPQEWLSAR